MEVEEEIEVLRRQWADLRAARAAEWPPDGAHMRTDEFASAHTDDFLPQPPDALPAEQVEELEAAAGDGIIGGARWVRRRALRPEGRLVVPRHEWTTLNPATPAVLQFFYSLLPWAMPAQQRAW